MAIMDRRITREQIHMSTACMWAARSLCSRLNVGAVITTKNMRRILAIGYNGPARGLPHNRCSGTEGSCGCLHAEDNAIAQVDSTIPDKILFVTHQPCEQCAQRIIQADISKVFYSETYRNDAGANLLRSCGVQVVQLKPIDTMVKTILKDSSLH